MLRRLPPSARGGIALLLAASLWLPSIHLFFRVDAAPILDERTLSPLARELSARHLDLWTDASLKEQEVKKMRRSNAEWDFMGRTFLVLGLANMAHRDPACRPKVLAVIDQILDETLRLEASRGFTFFLMDYARDRSFLRQPARSQFVDSEIALMLGVRRLLEERESYRPLLAERVRQMEEGIRAAPVMWAESYPDECWLFDNATALAAIKIADVLDGTDHTALFRDWIAASREELMHRGTGLFVSSCTFGGGPMDGPEGSSIWMAAHMLQIVDEGLAKDQYERARRELRRSFLGFGLAREWPVSARGASDIDSGMVVPILDAGAGSSGLALLGAAAFRDREFLSQLLTSLEFAGFPRRSGGRVRYLGGNQVGDAVLFYASVVGPLWAEVRRRDAR